MKISLDQNLLLATVQEINVKRKKMHFLFLYCLFRFFAQHLFFTYFLLLQFYFISFIPFLSIDYT
jgi:hypothetical protein